MLSYIVSKPHPSFPPSQIFVKILYSHTHITTETNTLSIYSHICYTKYITQMIGVGNSQNYLRYIII